MDYCPICAHEVRGDRTIPSRRALLNSEEYADMDVDEYIEDFKHQRPFICSECLDKEQRSENIKSLNKREYNFLSHSVVGKSYTVTQQGQNYKCDCPGFKFKKKCRHIPKAKKLSKKPIQTVIADV